MAVKGIFASDSNIPGSRKGDFATGLLQTEQTGDAPLFALTSGMGSADASDIIVTWFEENNLTGRLRITDDNTASDTALTVDDATQVTAGTLFLVENNGEMIYIESVAGNVLTVVRGFGGTPAAAINGAAAGAPDFAPIQRIGNAQEEGSGRQTAIANLGFPRFNYMQIFRNPWDVTGTAKAVEYHTGNLVAKSKADAARMHAADIERSLLHSRLATGVQNGKPFRTMDGITNQLSTNVQSESTNTTWNDIDLFLEGVFNRNVKGMPNERIAFCGNQVVRVLNEIARLDSTMNIMPSEDVFGIKIKKWETPFGDINLMTHPLFSETPFWTGDLLVLHPGVMRTRYLRRTMEDSNDMNGTRAGVDADFGTLTTEMSIEYKAEATGGYFTGISTAAAS